MAAAVACPYCKQEIPVPEGQAGRWFMCPSCDEALFVPAPEDPPEKGRAYNVPEGDEPVDLEEPFTSADRLGVAALMLGTLSVLILCIPFVGYAAFAMSGAGLLIGLAAICSSWGEYSWRFGRRRGRKDRAPRRPVNYPLAGTVACLVALILALLPFLY